MRCGPPRQRPAGGSEGSWGVVGVRAVSVSCAARSLQRAANRAREVRGASDS